MPEDSLARACRRDGGGGGERESEEEGKEARITSTFTFEETIRRSADRHEEDRNRWI